MAAESTFDVVSEFDRQELRNAIDQTEREVRTRFDLKDSRSELKLGDKDITITSDSEMHLQAVRDILESKAIRRGLSLKIFDYGEVEEVGGMRVRQVVTLKEGIADDLAKKLQKLIKEHAPKVQARIQGDAVRVGSKSKDDLQTVIRLLRERADDFPVPLQFTNYR
ncbi:MAG TPA: YajQ family cyclic di-GMP-binding protein [Herpetosiphonaceae bacterium]|nr:YajQ family cyclic di-GMP-binding protein [Herpetosiphonaceae bacterium]